MLKTENHANLFFTNLIKLTTYRIYIVLKRNLVINTIVLNGLVGAFCSAAWATQVSNIDCATAGASAGEAIGTLPLTQAGTLITDTNGLASSDFYKYTGTPGTLLKIILKPKVVASPPLVLPIPLSIKIDPIFPQPTPQMYPTINVLDSDCGVFRSISGYNTASVVLSVPDDGVLIVNATSYGIGGDYKLTAKPTNALGSITATVVDSVTKQPLINSVSDYTSADLLHCDSTKNNCQYIASGQSDEDGKISWSIEQDGTPLEVGFYQIVASSNQYEPKTSSIFAVAKDIDKSIVVGLKSSPVRVSTTNCTVPKTGGVCKFSVTFTTSQAKISATAWGIVDGNGINNLGQRTQFPLPAQSLTLSSTDNAKTLNYQFNVPANVQDGASICPNIYVGGLGADPSFDIKGTNSFCLIKGEGNTGFQILPANQLPITRNK